MTLPTLRAGEQQHIPALTWLAYIWTHFLFCSKRVRGPPEEEIQKKKAEARKVHQQTPLSMPTPAGHVGLCLGVGVAIRLSLALHLSSILHVSAGQPIHSRGQAIPPGWHPARRRWRGQRGVTVHCIQSIWHDMNGCHYMNFCNAMFDAVMLCYAHAWQL